MKKLLILSGKGGTGKTTTAAAFIRFSGAKAMADCDVDAPNLHIVNEFSQEPEKSDFIGSEKARIDPDKCVGCGACLEKCRFNAIQRHADGTCAVLEHACEGCGVCQYVCPAGAVELKEAVAGQLTLYRGERVFSTAKLKMGCGNSGKLVTQVKTNLQKAAPEAELAIIDGSPGIGCPVIASVTGVNLVLVVAEPSLSGLSDLQRIVDTAAVLRTPLAVCVNKYDTSPGKAEEIEAFCRDRDLPFVGKIPYDPTASAAINRGGSVADVDCPAGRALRQVYEKVHNILFP